MDIYYIISGILSLIVLICFFTIGSNVGAIKRKLVDNDTKQARALRQASYHTNRTLGKKAEAIEDLTYMLMLDLTVAGMTERQREEKYEQFKAANAAKFEALGAQFPKYMF